MLYQFSIKLWQEENGRKNYDIMKGVHMAKSNLLSNPQLANESSSNLLNASQCLNDLPSVGQGSTNAEVNAECTSAYESIQSILSSYAAVSARDAQRIASIGTGFSVLDRNLAGSLMR